MTDAVLELRGVTKTYPAGRPVTAIRDLSFAVHRGEVVAVTGPSGSGKSTMLGLLGLLDVPTRGTVLAANRDVGFISDAERSRLRGETVGFVFQQFNLIAHLTALANVETALLYRGLLVQDRRRRSVFALERLGVGHRMDHRPWQLSGGEQQRVALARAIVGRPSVIIADEPTGNLDTATGARVVKLLVGFAAEGVAVVIATHDPGIAAIASRVVHLRDGRLEQGR